MNIEEILVQIKDEDISENDIINIVVGLLSEECHINCTKLSNIITGLQLVKKSATDDWKNFCKEIQQVKNNEMYFIGKEYFDTLSEGSTIKFKLNDGSIVEGNVGSKRKNSKTAHIIFEGKDKYVKFYNIILES